MEKPPSPENNIELDNYCLDQFPKEIQDQLADEWYDAEMEARVGKDREQGLEHLRQFVDKLSKTPKKES
ncbi:hypothetical protein AUJ30_00315 [Candidatus Wolfebacteria bacterium CG1_02_39_135]|uniref:Uncharacterized protein n=1 Tax=Candidatus Wolfebacteria bacterium CG1_02_39_135 TaxID=1805425 RepID=A0A1J4XXT7_9BACT|nr:MAG: hypothetical protein AUJ30_00315 [Candidatus Wolfebacteria bacterium CG1_02_39_135]